MKIPGKALPAAVLLAGVLAFAPAARAEVIRVAPPPLRHEAVIARPGPRQVWVPGFWRWSGREYVWVSGAWQLPPGHHTRWVAGHYRTRRGGGWVYVPGRWH